MSILTLTRFWLLMACVISAWTDGVVGAADFPPNFIVIFTDDQGYGDLSCFGLTRIAPPNIDRLADEGVRMTSFYVTCRMVKIFDRIF